MKIRIDFTVEIDPACLDTLRELAGETSAEELRSYVRGEAEEALWSYLEGSGVRMRRVRSVYGEGTW